MMTVMVPDLLPPTTKSRRFACISSLICTMCGASSTRGDDDVDHGCRPLQVRNCRSRRAVGQSHKLNEAAVALFRAGHVPIIGVNMVLPMISAAGGSEATMASSWLRWRWPWSIAAMPACGSAGRPGEPTRR